MTPQANAHDPDTVPVMTLPVRPTHTMFTPPYMRTRDSPSARSCQYFVEAFMRGHRPRAAMISVGNTAELGFPYRNPALEFRDALIPYELPDVGRTVHPSSPENRVTNKQANTRDHYLCIYGGPQGP